MTLQEAYNKVRSHYNICIIPEGENISIHKYHVMNKAGMYIDCGMVECEDCSMGDLECCDILFNNSLQLREQIQQLEFIFKGQRNT